MNGEKKRILIMEDSDIFADMLLNFLNSCDYVLERAANGFEGIKKVYAFLPHLIITDIEMPLFKGYQVTRFLKSRKNTKPIPVIMFTSLDGTKDKFWASQAGADLYIEKSPDNLAPLKESAAKIMESSQGIDFNAIEREGKKINDNSIIEIVNNLLDNKLFQTTVIGLLAELSGKVHSMEMVAEGIFNLLHTICECEIAALMIKGSNRVMYAYTSNFGGFSKETANNFFNVCASDFNSLFPDFNHISKVNKDFQPAGTNNKKIISYINLPLAAAGEIFATVHIANSVNEYFSPAIMENINVFFSTATPVISNALSMHELAELQKNTRIAFSRYVPPDVMDEIINETTKKARMSENRNISVLFCDIRDFTGLSENLDAQSVVDFLNKYFTKMGFEIISEGGHIDKFIGDAIMAIFGAFQNPENSHISAIRAALKMLLAMDAINSTGNKLTKNNIHIGIGINCGECIMGNIGFKNKMDYTVIGDTVNLASRIESLTKIYRHPLIISEYVYDFVKDKFLMRKIDNVRVKGKDKSVGIYAVYSGFQGTGGNKLRSGEIIDIPAVSSLLVNRQTLVNYNKGLQVFEMREWKLAGEYFKKALDSGNDDYLSQIYLKRSCDFIQNPPPENWDGIITLDEK
uniref:Adenylate cyclase n=1 Tax=uncultured bacterium contig00019 TaxID=1181510 RepID=A0A806KIN0_9BACT|nr:adenylate cyclase [uncultured bacterium contig00019]